MLAFKLLSIYVSVVAMTELVLTVAAVVAVALAIVLTVVAAFLPRITLLAGAWAMLSAREDDDA